MKFKFLGVFKRVFHWLQNRVLTTKKTPAKSTALL